MSFRGKTVKEVRQLTDDECSEIGIPIDNIGNPYCFVLYNEDILFPVSDRAMNSGGGWRGDVDDIDSFEEETIEQVAPMSDEYMRHLDWDNMVAENSVVIHFSNGCSVYTASDSEGNSAGLLFQYSDNDVYEIMFE